ncbi:class I SAM-dependent methyltransferase [Salinigranum sp. GCM10025319]|uniref:class I SAM-dependent methyltransferase n=1 Tax=Salinigranum sp. GCM10025319 TaxID=3252687 RepID=UPI00361504DA
MDVPQTVTAALADRPVAGAVCLEAGAGLGNATAGLLAADARRVYAVTNDPDHATAVRERVVDDALTADRTAVLDADVRALPLADDSIDVVTAHGLCNLLTPAALDPLVAELTRVAAPGCHLVIDDYEPLPEAPVRELFALENAATELTTGSPALTFYPADVLRRLFVGSGWRFDRELTLLDPVPWTASHLAAHARATREAAARLPAELGDPLIDRTDRLVEAIGAASVGTMYSLAFRLPG